MEFRCWDLVYFFPAFSHGEYQFNKYLFKDIDWDVNLNELFVIQSQHKPTPHTHTKKTSTHTHFQTNDARSKTKNHIHQKLKSKRKKAKENGMRNARKVME